MNKAIIFDASTLISFSMTGLFEEFRKLKEVFNGKFLISTNVKSEVIDKPVERKRFELEALRIQKLLEDKVIELSDSVGVSEEEIQKRTDRYLKEANEIFVGNGQEIKIIHNGEASCLALSKILEEKGWKTAVAVDERTLRMLIEKPENLRDLLQRKLHVKIKFRKNNFGSFKGFRLIRSTELAYMIYKKGLIDVGNGRALDALLWAMKFKGCAISEEEISEIKRIR